ncbi:acyl carrier protein [Helicobacter aurati]|uniref:Acyl carrier protein n=1 Tax=Helicobacter aurati TaxID=137778 RepID=A0A3D8J8V9_9HELI|nr:phosphopantetheine-binding protein [Helicobacter aurati]RDU73635.1 acyl carrier protein [Helicobacter aurati]
MNLEEEIKELIISGLNLPDIKPSDIQSDSPLFNEGLGLDSVDALELGILIQKKYNITLDSKTMDLKAIFHNVETLTQFIAEQRTING